MGSREGLLLLVLVFSSTYADARNLIGVNALIDIKLPSEGEVSGSVGRNEQICTFCEEFTSQATYYLGENKTHAEIIETLHKTCSQMSSFEQQCVILVDFYVSLFFVEISKIQPEDFCRKVDLCENTVFLSIPKRDDKCTLCHRVVDVVLTKLKDPDTELGIIELLLKECSKTGQYVQECKRIVFRYGPLILANGEKFLETTDVCASIHACQASQDVALETATLRTMQNRPIFGNKF